MKKQIITLSLCTLSLLSRTNEAPLIGSTGGIDPMVNTYPTANGKTLNLAGKDLNEEIYRQSIKRAPEDIKVLLINNNNFTNIQKSDFERFKELTHLYAQNNRISSIASRCFENLNLLVIDLSNNNIEHLGSETLRGCHSLKELNLANNHINCINSKAFESCKASLQKLNLSGNPLSDETKMMLKDALPDINTDF